MSELNESQINYAIELDSLSWEQLLQVKEEVDRRVKKERDRVTGHLIRMLQDELNGIKPTVPDDDWFDLPKIKSES